MPKQVRHDKKMRATATQYAKTLYEATKDKNQEEIRDVVGNLVKVLAKNGQLKLAGGIMAKFGEVYNQKNGVVEAEVVSREKLNSQLVDKLTSFIKDKYSAKKAVIHNKIDEKVKGGVIIQVGDEIFDGSIDKKLVELKKELKK